MLSNKKEEGGGGVVLLKRQTQVEAKVVKEQVMAEARYKTRKVPFHENERVREWAVTGFRLKEEGAFEICRIPLNLSPIPGHRRSHLPLSGLLIFYSGAHEGTCVAQT